MLGRLMMAWYASVLIESGRYPLALASSISSTSCYAVERMFSGSGAQDSNPCTLPYCVVAVFFAFVCFVFVYFLMAVMDSVCTWRK